MCNLACFIALPCAAQPFGTGFKYIDMIFEPFSEVLRAGGHTQPAMYKLAYSLSYVHDLNNDSKWELYNAKVELL